MTALRGFLRRLLVWWLPGLAMLAVLACSFVFWLLASQTGTRLLLTTAAQQLDGQALDVRGSVLRGLDVGRLDLNISGTRIGISDLRLSVHWRALGNRLLHVREISAGNVEVALIASDEATAKGEDEPFTLPSLPVDIAVDRLALGEFHLLQDGQPLPVELGDLNATFAAGKQGAQLRIANLRVGHEVGQAQLSGQAELQGLADPWPFTARLDVMARGSGPASPLCQADQLSGKFAPPAKPQEERPKASEAAKPRAGKAKGESAKAAAGARPSSATPTEGAQAKTTDAFVGPPAPACQVMLQADAAGSLDGIQAKLDGTGAGLALEVMADLAPRTPLVLRSARAEARLPDQSTLSARLDLRAVDGQPGRDRIVGTVGARRLDLSPWLGDAIPPAIVSASAQLSAEFENLSQLRQAAIDLRFEDGARWNKQALAGAVKARVDIAAPAAGPRASASAV
ncbi:hypothetical protein ABZR37_27490, partial [Achromobacter ruhlandii]